MKSIEERERPTNQSGPSIGVPAFNEGGSIRQATESLLNLGTDLPHEILVVDDDSRDGIPDLARTLAQADDED